MDATAETSEGRTIGIRRPDRLDWSQGKQGRPNQDADRDRFPECGGLGGAYNSRLHLRKSGFPALLTGRRHDQHRHEAHLRAGSASSGHGPANDRIPERIGHERREQPHGPRIPRPRITKCVDRLRHGKHVHAAVRPRGAFNVHDRTRNGFVGRPTRKKPREPKTREYMRTHSHLGLGIRSIFVAPDDPASVM